MIRPSLTLRERQVSNAVARGWRNRQIGEALGITERTVKKHVASACRKLGAASRLELALKVRTSRTRH
ncbi:MAG: response regulator transcription factor [Vicinamibacterales bacterium]